MTAALPHRSATGLVPGTGDYRRLLIALTAAGTTTFGQLYYPQAILPQIAASLDGTAAEAALSVSGASIGLAVTALGWSAVADRLGRRRSMRIALLGAAAMGLLVPFAPSLPDLVVLRVVQGIALGGVPAAAITYLNEQVRKGHSILAAGTFIASTSVGGLTGRVIAASLADFAGWRVAGMVVGVLSVAGALVFVVVLPAPIPAVEQAEPRVGESVLNAVRASLCSVQLRSLYVQAFLLMGAYVTMYNFLGYRLQQAPFHLAPAVTGLVFLVTVVGAFSSTIAARLARRRGQTLVLVGSGAAMVAGTTLTLADRIPVVLLGLVVFSAAFFAAHSVASGAVAATAATGRGQAASLYTISFYAGSSLFGWLGGVAFAHGWTSTASLVIGIATLAVMVAPFSRSGQSPAVVNSAVTSRPVP